MTPFATHVMRVAFTAFCVLGVMSVCHGCTCARKREWKEVAGAVLVVSLAVFWAATLFNAGWL